MGKSDDKINAIVRKAKTISAKMIEIGKTCILTLYDHDHLFLIHQM